MPSPEPGPAPDARFSLANERTFLAYERTAVGLLVAATAVLHLLDPDDGSTLLGGALLVTAALAGVGGWVRFRTVDRVMRDGSPMPANPLPHLLVAGVVLCVVAVAVSALW